jgi:hypothetical protein
MSKKVFLTSISEAQNLFLKSTCKNEEENLSVV